MATRPYRIDPAVARERARNAGRASHSPRAFARGLVRAWPRLTDAEVAEIRDVLRPVLDRLASRPPDEGMA